MWPTSNTLAQVRKHIQLMLSDTFPDKQEQNVLTSLILQYITGLSKTEIAIQPDFRVNESDVVWLKNALEDLNKHKPIQYVIGYEEFYGLRFNVNKHVLIPRPETEELVKWILDDFAQNQEPLIVLDLGTGSGCIAIALKHEQPNWSVSGIDKSEGALMVARSNAKLNNVDVEFSENDLLNFVPIPQNYDIIVSNPPYIRKSEKKLMQQNVLAYEPEMALFVEDENPLVFYKAIAQIAQKQLKSSGKLYLEINEALGEEMVQMLKEQGFAEVELRCDLFGKPRMVNAIK
jgi:release factor glutamine methyltransferase